MSHLGCELLAVCQLSLGKKMMIQINEYIFPLEDFILGSLEI